MALLIPAIVIVNVAPIRYESVVVRNTSTADKYKILNLFPFVYLTFSSFVAFSNDNKKRPCI